MKVIFVLITALIVIACNDNTGDEHATHRKDGFTKTLKTKEDSLYQEVMDGHDIGMAKLGKMTGYIKAVNKSIDSIKSSGNPDQKKLVLLQSIAADLSQADYSMNRWMEEFKIDSAKDQEAARLAYLESERDKINTIKQRILSGIERADSLYSKK
jgi:hypothetical protein